MIYTDLHFLGYGVILHRVLHLSQCCHDFHRVGLAGDLMNLGVLGVSHQYKM